MNSEPVSLESFAEAGDRLCGPDSDRELVLPLRCKKGEENDSTCEG